MEHETRPVQVTTRAAKKVEEKEACQTPPPKGNETDSESPEENLKYETIKQLQEEDQVVGKILKAKQEETRPKWEEISRECQEKWEEILRECEEYKFYWARWDSLEIRQGVLYYRWEGAMDGCRLIIPQSLHIDILTQLHDTRTSGHLGEHKTLGKAHQLFMWYKMKDSVSNWCRKEIP